MARKVLIVCNGDHIRGMGHLVRMKVLGDALASAMGCSITYLVDPETILAPLLCEKANGEVLIAVRDDFRLRGNIIRDCCPDLVIADVYGAQFEELRTYRVMGSTMMVLDNLGPAGIVADCVVNAIVGGLENRKWRQGSVLYHSGPRYMILHPEYHLRRRAKPGISKFIRTIGVALGGADARDLTEAIGEWLLLAAPDARILLIGGPGALRVRAGPRVSDRLQTVEAPSNLAMIMGMCDLMITGGGITPYEAACLGVPAVIVPQAPHEVLTARRLERYGSASILPPEGGPEALTRVISELTPDARRRAMSVRGLELLDGSLDSILGVAAGLLH